MENWVKHDNHSWIHTPIKNCVNWGFQDTPMDCQAEELVTIDLLNGFDHPAVEVDCTWGPILPHASDWI